MTKPLIKQLLASESANRLLTRVRQLQSLSNTLHDCLPADLVQHTQVVRWENGRLTVQTDSAAWATRLRYLTPQLLRCLRQSPTFAEARHIELRVAPLAASTAPAVQRAYLSPHSASIIDANADSIADPLLRAALKRLARHGEEH